MPEMLGRLEQRGDDTKVKVRLRRGREGELHRHRRGGGRDAEAGGGVGDDNENDRCRVGVNGGEKSSWRRMWANNGMVVLFHEIQTGW